MANADSSSSSSSNMQINNQKILALHFYDENFLQPLKSDHNIEFLTYPSSRLLAMPMGITMLTSVRF